MARKVNELIWHCTATPAGREVTVKEIDRWHRERGWSGIGYHKVVHLDGLVTSGRPETQVGAHVANRNANTIGYVYVGGVDANDPKKARDTRTPAQKKTMERLTREAIERYGLTKVSGHRDYANKACPCFDARAEYAHLLPAKAQHFIPDVEDERDSKYDDPIRDDARAGFFHRARNWVVGGLSSIGFGGVGLLTDWQIAAIAFGFVLVLIVGVVGFAFWLFGKDRVRDWIARQVG